MNSFAHSQKTAAITISHSISHNSPRPAAFPIPVITLILLIISPQHPVAANPTAQWMD